MAKNVSLKEVLKESAKDFVIPESTKDSIWTKIQENMEKPQVREHQLFDGDYPAFGTDISELV